MKNEQLKKDLEGILSNKSNVISYTKNDNNGKSIEIVYREPSLIDIYVYYNNEDDRDNDFELLQKKLLCQTN